VLPDWSALTVQVPAANKVKVEPFTVQTDVVEEEKLTAKEDEAVAESVIGVPTEPVDAGLKLMVWLVNEGGEALPPPHPTRMAEVTSARLAKLI